MRKNKYRPGAGTPGPADCVASNDRQHRNHALIRQRTKVSPVLPVTMALVYAKRGWYVFPAPPGQKKSYKSAKFSDGEPWGATVYAHLIEQDFTRWPNANVGIVTGPKSGIFVVEADTPKGHGVDGIASLRELERKHGKLKTLTAKSPSGSLHYYFLYPEQL